MKQDRYNSFNQIHKGLRAMLYETGIRLQQADLSTHTAESLEAIGQVEEVLYLFESHAFGEDQFFNEPLEKFDSQIAQLFVKEHEEDHRLGAVLSDLIRAWRNETNRDSMRDAGKNLLYAFNEFIAFNLYHMNKEEIELNAALWEQYSDSEIKAIEQTLVQQIPPQKMARYARWMIRGINDVEMLNWFDEVRKFAPGEVFGMLLEIARTQLSGDRLDALTRRLNISQANVL